MSVISRYLAGMFFKHLGLCLLGFVTLFLVVDFIEKISDFLTKDIPVGQVALFFVAQIPAIAVMLAPVAALASVLISLVLLARNSEIVAFKGSGVSLVRLSRPFVCCGLVLSFLVLLIGNLVTPLTSRYTNALWEVQVRNRRSDVQSQAVEDVWLKDVRLFEHLGSYDESKKMAQGVTLIMLDSDLDLARRLEAERGFFSPNGLRLFGVREKTYQAQDGPGRPLAYSYSSSEEVFLAGHPVPPEGIGRRAEQNTNEMNIKGLLDTIGNLEAEGFNPVRQTVDLHLKLVSPFISLIMILVGLPIGFWREKGGSVALGLVWGLVISFFYMVAQEVARSLGYAGLLPPVLAAWLPNCFFFLLSLYLFSHVRQ
ncbi:MAG: LPS export ABC transporter permease LptG [Deltaproteobacteria bacterium]|jgi:lipopolysaccharide export system permease protein|nr:LPS export ABC transporter permease LptG [Deltaproteobacteria bacterium]